MPKSHDIQTNGDLPTAGAAKAVGVASTPLIQQAAMSSRDTPPGAADDQLPFNFDGSRGSAPSLSSGGIAANGQVPQTASSTTVVEGSLQGSAATEPGRPRKKPLPTGEGDKATGAAGSGASPKATGGGNHPTARALRRGDPHGIDQPEIGHHVSEPGLQG
jgi:hypothetical protein